MEIIETAKRFIVKISPAQKAAFYGTVIWGLITHLAVFSAGLMYRDGVNYSGLCATYTSGRWMLGIIEDISAEFKGIYQLPYLNGFITIFFIAVAAIFVTYLLHIKLKFTAALIGALLISFPGVASLFAFMFTAPAYALSLLMSVLAIYFVNEKQSLPRIALGACFVCLSLGIYQAYITVAASLALIIIICDGLRDDSAGVETLFKKGCVFLLTLLIGLLLYLLVNKLVLALKDLSLTDYQNLNKMGQFTFEQIKTAIYLSYYYQFNCVWWGIETAGFFIRFTQAVEIITILLFAYRLYREKKNIGKCIFLLALFALLPIAYNSITLICANGLLGIHALMRYALVFTYVFPVVLIEIVASDTSANKFEKLLSSALLVVCACVSFTFTYRDNTAYLNASVSQQQAVLYANSMITRIRDTDGYRDELPVAYIGSFINDKALEFLPGYDTMQITMLDLSAKNMVGDMRWRKFYYLHLGWSPEEITDTSAIAGSSEVKAMPCYPDDGSIKVINDVVVVKLSDTD